MTQPSVQPTLASLLQLVKQDVLLAINCVSVGTIESFSATKQKAKISLNYKRVIRDGQGGFTASEYPVLADVPCVVIGGGGGRLSFPIAAGDECLIFFADRDLDAWLANDQVLPPNSARLHSFSDAIALVGVRAFPGALEDYDATNVELTSPAKVGISNDTTDLKTVLNGVIDQIQALATAITPTTGLTAPALTTITAALTAYKVTIAGLLK